MLKKNHSLHKLSASRKYQIPAIAAPWEIGIGLPPKKHVWPTGATGDCNVGTSPASGSCVVGDTPSSGDCQNGVIPSTGCTTGTGFQPLCSGGNYATTECENGTFGYWCHHGTSAPTDCSIGTAATDDCASGTLAVGASCMDGGTATSTCSFGTGV